MLLLLLLHWLSFFILGGWGGRHAQRRQRKHLLWQFIEHNIPMPKDVKDLNILNILTFLRLL